MLVYGDGGPILVILCWIVFVIGFVYTWTHWHHW
jgi:hypothetical protein